MKRYTILITALLLLGLLASTASAAPTALSGHPSFRVVNVEPDGYVTLHLYNFPDNTDVQVLMGPYGTLAIGGAKMAGVTVSGDAEFKVEIAGSVKGQSRGAVRLEAPAKGIFLSASFNNVEGGTSPVSTTTTTTTTSTTSGTGGPTTTTSGGASFYVYNVDGGYIYLRLSGFASNTDVKVFAGPVGGTDAQVGGVTVSGSADFKVEKPTSLSGLSRGEVRLQTSRFSLYATFANVDGGTSARASTAYGTGGTYTGSVIVPIFDIMSVETDSKVTIQTANFPASDSFNVLMNNYGTLGIGGIHVDTVSSGSGGVMTFTFNIPDSLKGQKLIAIRLESPTSGYYSYNWFTNKTGATYGTDGPVVSPAPVSFVIPTFDVTGVSRDNQVTIQTANFPSGDTFDAYINVYGTLGIGGVWVGSVSSGSGGVLTFTFNIPDSLKGRDRLSIRLQSPSSDYFSYNWFWNKDY